MKETSLNIAATALTVWFCLQAGFAMAQEPNSVFGDVLDVQVVNVEVVVTDRQGVRVLGLGPEVFTLLVDGVETEVEYFTEVRGGIARPPAPSAEVPEIQVAEVRPGQAVGTSYLVFIDEFFSVARDRDQVLEELQKQLAYLGRNDRMAVVAFDGRKVTMLSSWSQSQNTLREVFDQATRRPTFGRLRMAELRQLDLDEGGFGNRRSASQSNYYLDLDELYYAQQLEDQLDRSVAAATSTLRGFASPPGRKVMLLLSGGWPNHPAEYVIDDYQRPILDSQVRRGEGIFRPLTDTANLLGYTLYPIDVPGFNPRTGVDVARRNPGPGISVRETDQHHTLDYLARQTGGESFINTDRLEVMENVHQDLAAYYWLGFTPKRASRDANRKVEVRLAGRGLQVRHRRGFQDYSRSTEMTMAVESALLFGQNIGDSGLDVQLGKGKRAGVGKVEVPIVVTIPLDIVTVVPYGSQLRGEVELRVAVQDEDGRMAPTPVVRLQLSLDEPPEPGATDRFQTVMKLRKVDHDLVFSIHDPASGRMLMTSERYEP